MRVGVTETSGGSGSRLGGRIGSGGGVIAGSDAQPPSAELELLDAVVVGLGDGHEPVAVDRDAGRLDELARRRCRARRSRRQRAVRVEGDDAVVAAVGDPEAAGGVERDPRGRAQLADAELADVAAGGGQDA